MVSENDIKRIEKALGFKLYPMVIQYICTDKQCYFSGRASGKIIAYMIKLALSKDKSITIKDLNRGKYNDELHDRNYVYWFRNEFLKVRELLKLEGLEVINIEKV